ncbi:MAG: glutamate-cysteine ligase family protein [Planctomycetaceae bacterium]
MSKPLHLFEGYGVELEYMIVDRETLSVRPISDVVLRDADGAIASEIEHGALAWSNELTAHVIELKTNGPAKTLDGLADEFQSHVRKINQLLEPAGAALMPTAMHPLMDPHREMHLWEHDYSPVYESFHRIFDCRGHGWANLQSVHINLPFDGDEEFGRLHAAIRLVLPLLPALAASSPVVEGRLTGTMDNRLVHYRTNAKAIPSISAQVVPEAVFTKAEYEEQIFGRIYRDIAPHDPDGILQHEWLNARGAIARFDRGAIEIRVLDIQEFPTADLAICSIIAAVLKNLVTEEWSTLASQKAAATDNLAELLVQTTRDAQAAVVSDGGYRGLFGIDGVSSLTAGEIWRTLAGRLTSADIPDPRIRAAIDNIVEHGTLAQRITARLERNPQRAAIVAVCRELMDCLADGRAFIA